MWVTSIPSNIIFHVCTNRSDVCTHKNFEALYVAHGNYFFFQRTHLCILGIHHFKNGITLAKFKPLWFMSMLHNILKVWSNFTIFSNAPSENFRMKRINPRFQRLLWKMLHNYSYTCFPQNPMLWHSVSFSCATFFLN